MTTDSRESMGSVYAYIFAVAFWCISIIPLFKPGLTLIYLPQTFLGREQLIEAFNTVRLRLGDRVFPQVLVGKDDWLYLYTTSEVGDYQHASPFTKKELVGYQRQLDAIDASLEQKGITFLVVIPPDKASIYPQYLPDEIKVFPGPSRLDQFIKFMHEHGRTPIVDFRPALRQASQTQMVYYKTDAHYTEVAWYIVYAKILSALSQRYPELQPHPLSDYRVVPGGMRTMQLPGLMGLPYIQEATRGLQPKFPQTTYTKAIPLPEFPGQRIEFAMNQDQSLPKLLILHDSFLVTVVPLLEPHFRETASVFRNLNPQLWSMDWVDEQHPDIVILEFTEFYMNFMDQSIPTFK
jgi:hypothetical protein